MTRPLQTLVHLACRELGIDADARHAIQLKVTGKESLCAMSEAELARMVDHFKALGFAPTSRTTNSGQRPAATRPDVRFAHVLWRLLADAGEVKVRGAKGLNAFIRQRFGGAWGSVPIDIDAMRDARQIAAVIEALKDWCARAGVRIGGEG